MAVFDEKKKTCPSHYKYARCPKGNWCHWISELAVCLSLLDKLSHLNLLILVDYCPHF